MTQADHYRDQSTRARRLAQAVKDPEASKKLIEMAEEFRLYAERLEQTHYAERLRQSTKSFQRWRPTQKLKPLFTESH